MTLLCAGCREAKLPHNDVHTSSHAKPKRLAPDLQRGTATRRAALRCKALQRKADAASSRVAKVLQNWRPDAYLALLRERHSH